MTFEEVLRTQPGLNRVGFYHLTCSEHGTFRMLANGVVPDRCPRCSQPARVSRPLKMNCATRRPVPLVQRWAADNQDTSRHTAPAWLRRQGEIQDC